VLAAGVDVFDDPPQPAASSSVEAAKTAARRTIFPPRMIPIPRVTALRYVVPLTATAWSFRIVTRTGLNGRRLPVLRLSLDAMTGVGDDYVAVGIDGNGRVDYYGRLFSARPLAAALDVVRSELPADAVLGKPVTTSSRAGSKCLLITAISVTAGTVLGGPAGSRIEVELQSWDGKVLDQSAIASASIASANRSDALDC